MRLFLLPTAAALMVVGADSAADLPTVPTEQWVAASSVLLASACGGIGGGCFKNANSKVTFLFPATTAVACQSPELSLTEWRPAYAFTNVSATAVFSPEMRTAAIDLEATLVADEAKTPIAHMVVLYTAPVIAAAQTSVEEWGTAAGVTFTKTSCSAIAGLLYAMMNDVQASEARKNPMFAMVMPLPNKMKLLRSLQEFGPNGAALGAQSSGLDISLAGGAGDLAAAATRIETTLAATKQANPSMSVVVNENTKQVQITGISPTDLLAAANAASTEREIAVIRPSRSFDTSNVANNEGSIGVIVGGTIAALLVVGGAFMYGHRKKHSLMNQHRHEQAQQNRPQQQGNGGGGRGEQQRQQGRQQQQRQTQGGQGRPHGQPGQGQGRPHGRPGQGQGRPGQSMKPGGTPMQNIREGSSMQNMRGGNGGGGRGMTSMQSGGGGGNGRAMNSKYSGSNGSKSPRFKDRTSL